jgi:M6 family metalloprotease-like protein
MVRRYLITFWILFFSGSILLANNIVFKKKTIKSNKTIKTLPHNKIFNTPNKKNYKSSNSDRILVILVDFQEDNDPTTTGNGKFQLKADSTYKISIGAPPHNKEYFSEILKAVSYYYNASSYGFYIPNFDIFPRHKTCYTLPHEMAYYNPGTNSPDFVSKTEEYFHDAFTIADNDTDINFSDYGHFMIIHAGADWQNDINNDSPHDLPTMHVSLSPESQIQVDNGTTTISYAFSIPETNSQDGHYGVPTAKICHEFGHSLGLIDLYNVKNFHPAVGYWDIMDSGGSTVLTLKGTDDKYYDLEGAIPSLPCAWNRLLLWGEDFYRSKGMLKDVTEIGFNKTVHLKAAELPYKMLENNLYIVKVPISDHEYLLIENREVDANQDGGTAFHGALPITAGGTDFRVIVYPTDLNNNSNKPNYEYDFVLPGWVSENGSYLGGGLVIWDINDKIIYQEGTTDSNGEFVSNFDNNTINIYHKHRGVKIIEADGNDTIGNPNSYFWTGTAFNTYFKWKPELNSEGYFVKWTDNIFNDSYNCESNPKFVTAEGNPVIYSIENISSIGSEMSFNFGLNFMDSASKICKVPNIQSVGLIGKQKHLGGVIAELPLIHNDSLVVFSHYYNSSNQQDFWENFYWKIYVGTPGKLPIISMDLDCDGDDEYSIIKSDSLIVISPKSVFRYKFDSEIIDTPVYYKNNKKSFFAIATKDSVYIRSNMNTQNCLPIENAKICADNNIIHILNNDKLTNYDLLSGHKIEINSNIPLGKQYPVSLNNNDKQEIFFWSNDSKIYKFGDSSPQEIFNLRNFTTSNATNLGLAVDPKSNIPIIFFGAGNLVFAINIDGSLFPGFPMDLVNSCIKEYSDITIINKDKELIGFVHDTTNGILGININKAIPEDIFGLHWNSNTNLNYFYWENESAHFSFIYSDLDGNVFQVFSKYFKKNPIIWEGYKNGINSSINYTGKPIQTEFSDFSTNVFPNPVKNHNARIRISGKAGNYIIKIYDIAGNEILNKNIKKEFDTDYDFRWYTKNLSSGIYFGFLEHYNKKKKISIVIEK